jgi:hypothetical protein
MARSSHPPPRTLVRVQRETWTRALDTDLELITAECRFHYVGNHVIRDVHVSTIDFMLRVTRDAKTLRACHTTIPRVITVDTMRRIP